MEIKCQLWDECPKWGVECSVENQIGLCGYDFQNKEISKIRAKFPQDFSWWEKCLFLEAVDKIQTLQYGRA